MQRATSESELERRRRYGALVMRWIGSRIRGSLLAFVVLTGCGERAETPTGATARRLVITPPNVALLQRDFTSLAVSVVDKNGTPVPDAAVAFRSTDASVASVDANGTIVTGLATGATVVTVSALGLTQDIPVVVRQRLTSVDFLPNLVTIRQLDTLRLGIRPLDLAGELISEAQVTLFTEDTTIVRITPSGALISRGPLGSATITATATYAGKTTNRRIGVPVKPGFASLELQSPTLTVGQGTSARVFVTARDLLGQPIADPEVEFTSSDTTLIRTTPRGVLYSVGKLGSARVDVVADGIRREVSVTVSPLVRHEWNMVALMYQEDVDYIPPHDLAMSEDGTFITSTGVIGSWRALRLFPPSLPITESFSVAVDTGLAYAYFALSKGLLAVNLRTARQVWNSPHGPGSHHLVASRTVAGQVVYTHQADAIVLDARTGATSWRHSSLANSAWATATHPTLPIVWVSWGAAGFLTELNVHARTTRTITIGSVLAGLFVSATGKLLFVVDASSQSLLVYDAVTLSRIRHVNLGAGCSLVAGAPDGSEIYLACYESRSIVIVDGAATRVLRRIEVDGHPDRVVVSPDGGTLVVVLRDIGLALLR